jgi:hypothetical protein
VVRCYWHITNFKSLSNALSCKSIKGKRVETSLANKLYAENETLVFVRDQKELVYFGTYVAARNWDLD